MSFKFERSYNRKKNINLTPLIDIVFLLVVFFMLTSKFVVSSQIDMSVSTISGEDDISVKNKAIIVSLVRKDEFDIFGKTYDSEGLAKQIRAELSENDSKEIVIKSHSKSNVQHIVQAMDVIRASGGFNISISEGS